MSKPFEGYNPEGIRIFVVVSSSTISRKWANRQTTPILYCDTQALADEAATWWNDNASWREREEGLIWSVKPLELHSARKEGAKNAASERTVSESD